MILSMLLGQPTLRLSGTYFPIVTLGFGEVVKKNALNWDVMTNGTLRVKNIPKPELFGIKLTAANNGLYYLMVLMLLIMTCFCIDFQTGKGMQVAGAKAEAGGTLLEVKAAAQKAVNNIRSMGGHDTVYPSGSREAGICTE